jgi:hypothetical protein
VLSEKKILNETKNHTSPPCKLNGRSLSRFGYFALSYFCYIIDVVYWSCVIAHQNQNIFFSNIGNQNIFLEKTITPSLQVKWSFPYLLSANNQFTRNCRKNNKFTNKNILILVEGKKII